MIVDKNVRMPVAAAPVAGTARTDQNQSNRSAWQREMERQEMAAWFSHPALQPGRAAPALPAAAPKVAHARAVARATPAMAPAASAAPTVALQPGGVAHATPLAVASPSRPGTGAANGAAAQDTRPVDQASGPGSRTAEREDDAALSEAATKTTVQTSGEMPMSAAVLVAAVMTHLEPAQAIKTVVGMDAPGQAQVAPAAGGLPDTDVGPASVAPPLASDLPATSQFVRRLPQAGAGGMASEEGAHAGEAQQPRTGSVARNAAAGIPSPQLRIHTIRTEEGIRIWIGADQAAGLSCEQLLDAAQDIRRLLQSQGTPLAALIYNGQSVFDADEGPEDGGGYADRDASPPRVRGNSGTSPRIES